MAKTGAELKTALLGEHEELVDGTVYSPSAVKVKVVLSYEYSVEPVDEDDDGTRQFARVVTLERSDFAGLSASTRQEMLGLVESKL